MSNITMPTWRSAKFSYTVVVLCWIFYGTLTLMSPVRVDPRFHLTETGVELLRLTIIIPLFLIWLISLRGAHAFMNYAKVINGSPEAAGIRLIAVGLLWLLGYLISITLTGAVVPYFVDTPYQNIALIIRNHLPAFLSLVAFWYLYIGSCRLYKAVKFRTWTRLPTVLMTGFGVFAILFSIIFLNSGVTTDTSGLPVYSAPRDVLLFTLVLPYLIAWFVGILASINITKYAQQVKGVIYRDALRDLVRGIIASVCMAVILQLYTILSRFISTLHLNWFLLTVYVILGIYALGCWYIYRGAHKLIRIEVVE